MWNHAGVPGSAGSAPADCEHEVEPLTGGYRIALVYTLSLSDSRAALSAPDHSGSAAAVSDALARLFDDEAYQRLAISLDHEYTKASLGPAALKGADRPRFEVLAGVAAERGYDCNLALLTHHQLGEADYGTLDWEPLSWSGRRGQRGAPGGPDYGVSDVEIAQIYQEEWKLEPWVAAGGRPRKLGAMNLDPSEIVRDPDLELPYEQEVHEATGNEGVSVDRWYHEAVVVLWPRSHYVDLLVREGRAFAVPALAEMINMRGHTDVECLRFAKAILDHWERRPPYEHLQGELTSRMLRCLTRLGDAELSARFLREVMPGAIGAQCVSGLAALCERLGWTPCREPIVEMVAAQAEPTSHPDFPILVDAVTGLCARGSMTAPRQEVCRAAMEALADVVASLDDRPADDWRYSGVIDRTHVLAPIAIALRSVGALEFFEPFVDRALEDPTRYDFRAILVPAAVAIHAKRDPEFAADPAVQRLHEHVVAELLAATVSAPEAPSDWRQAVTLGHRCADCQELEDFANDPDAQVHHFKIGKHRRRHLHEQIDHRDH